MSQLIKPPSKKFLYLHTLLAETYVHVNTFNSTIKDDIKWRDNRYAAVVWQVQEGKKSKYRPDAELFINDKIVSIEADRATESSSMLKEKFRGYFSYFDHLKQKEQQDRIPKTILFVLESSWNKRRTQTIIDSWLETMGDYVRSIDLYVTSISDLTSFIKDYYYSEELTGKFAVQIDSDNSVYNMKDSSDFPYKDTFMGVEGAVAFWAANRPADEGRVRYDRILHWLKFDTHKNLVVKHFVPILWTTTEIPNVEDLPHCAVYETDTELSFGIWHFFTMVWNSLRQT
ncbi:hypothetical protein GGQ92_000291 [Gracilibacillus halotolerans]|uniref:Uncharacterized protein n=1 Tax=Gracilibacillus halotolerans TaxID=74386 RepID=A0A841RKM6_9BACI|nr:replication-relaxation family protein [Gracilibacillus halotolerans]MBB6511524.1 hypothetical protein [Gracilibacillus halotolerans]